MFGRKAKSSILALALAVPLRGEAQLPPGPPPGADPQGPPAWGQQRGPGAGPGWQRGGFGQGQGMGRGRGGMRGRGMRGRGMRGRGLGRLLKSPAMRERLGFTADQAAKIEAQESVFAKARIQNRTNLQLRRMELDELVNAEKTDRAAIDKKLREFQDAQTAAHKAMIEHRLAMREMITPEQREKMREMMQERWQGRPGRGPRGPQAPAAPPAPQPPAPEPGS